MTNLVKGQVYYVSRCRVQERTANNQALPAQFRADNYINPLS